MAQPVTLLSFDQSALSHRFLINLERALSLRIAPSTVALAPLLEKEKGWDLFFSSSRLHYLIAFPPPWDRFPLLRSFLSQNTATGAWFLQKKPLLLLRPFSDYQTNPLYKKKLWQDLCQRLASLPSS